MGEIVPLLRDAWRMFTLIVWDIKNSQSWQELFYFRRLTIGLYVPMGRFQILALAICALVHLYRPKVTCPNLWIMKALSATISGGKGLTLGKCLQR